jgi:uncharacterized OsmC-like protein
VRQINAGDKNLTAEAIGEIEKEDNVLVIKRIHVIYKLNAPEEARETVERVHAMHAAHCPVYRSLDKAIDITTEYHLETNR